VYICRIRLDLVGNSLTDPSRNKLNVAYVHMYVMLFINVYSQTQIDPSVNKVPFILVNLSYAVCFREVILSVDNVYLCTRVANLYMVQHVPKW
jgi:hypothetical protein